MVSPSNPDIHLYRGNGSTWMPAFTDDITNFLLRYRLREAGNYAMGEYELTLKNVTGSVVGVFTDTSRDTQVRPLEFFKLTVDNGNVSRVVYGYFGSYDSDYTETPPNTVTFHGKDLRWPLNWRAISVNYNFSTAPTNASDAIAHMFTYPDDSPNGSDPLPFVLSAGGSGLNYIVPDSNFENQHPTTFKALTHLLQNLGYEHRIVVTANGSAVINMFQTGQSYHSPNISFVIKGVTDVTNNAVRARKSIDYDEIANVIGAWADKITRIPAVWDVWTDWAAWNNSAWNVSDSTFWYLHNFSCNLDFVLVGDMVQSYEGMNTSVCVMIDYLAAGEAVNTTTGVTLTFPSMDQSSQVRLDDYNALFFRFKLACENTWLPSGALFAGNRGVRIRMQDDVGNVIENNCLLDGLIFDVYGAANNIPNWPYLSAPGRFMDFALNVNHSTRKINYSSGAVEEPGWDWYKVANNNGSFNFNSLRHITFLTDTPTLPDIGGGGYRLRWFIDDPYFECDLPVNPRALSILLPLAYNQSSIDAFGRRFKAVIDNRIKTIADALAVQSTELVKNKEPARRIQILSIDALHAEVGQKITVDCPVYGINSNAGNTDWGVLQVQHEWQVGEPNIVTVDLVYPATPSSPYISLTTLRLTSFDPNEQLAGLLEELRDRIDTLPTNKNAGGGTVFITGGGGEIPDSISVTDLAATNGRITNLSFGTGYGNALNVSNIKTGVMSSLGVYSQSGGIDNLVASTGRFGNLSAVKLYSQSADINNLNVSGLTINNISAKTINVETINVSTINAGVENFSDVTVGNMSFLAGYGNSLNVSSLVTGAAIVNANLSVAGNLQVQSRILAYNVLITTNSSFGANLNVQSTLKAWDVIFYNNVSVGGVVTASAFNAYQYSMSGNPFRVFMGPTNTVSGGAWYRIATIPYTAAVDSVQAIATFTLMERHALTKFSIGGVFNQSLGLHFVLLDNAWWTTPQFKAVRLLTKTTYDPMYIEVQTDANEALAYLYEGTPQFYNVPITLHNFSMGGIDAGYTAYQYNLSTLVFGVGGQTDFLTINRSGQVVGSSLIFDNASLAGKLTVQSCIQTWCMSATGVYAISSLFNMVNTSQAVIGKITVSENLSVAGSLQVQSSINGYTGIFGGNVSIGGDLMVTGKITASGGVDPPYVSYCGETRERIVELSQNVHDRECIMQFYNISARRVEFYNISEQKFFRLSWVPVT